MSIEEWLNAMPRVFPDLIDYYDNNTAYQNPLIGETYDKTHRNVCEILSFLTLIALPKGIEKADFSLDEDSTWGYIRILQCMTGALKFEEEYRPDGGEPVENKSVG